MTAPLPPENKPAVHDLVEALRARGVRDIYEIAEELQDLWPGCTASQARGVVAGLKSKEMGGVSKEPQGQKAPHALKRAQEEART